MKASKLAFLISLICCAPTYGASSCPSSIKYFKVLSPNSISQDYCLDEALPSKYAKLVVQISFFQGKVADFFQVKQADLFRKSVGITISTGPAHNAAGGNKITLKVRQDAERINDSSLVHELGHIVQEQDNIVGLPPLINALGTSSLFSEGFSDSLAIALTGHIISPDQSNSVCKGQLRFVTNSISFDGPEMNFDKFAGSRRVLSCCQSLAPYSATESGSCADYINSLEKEILAGSLTKFRPQPVQFFSSPPGDPHEFGLPINSFILDLSENLKRPFSEALKEGLRLGSNKSKRRFFCAINRKRSPTVQVNLFTGNNFFLGLKEWADSYQQNVFESLWTKHGLDIAMKIVEIDGINAAIVESSKVFEEGEFGSSCKKYFDAFNFKAPGCTIVCHSPAK